MVAVKIMKKYDFILFDLDGTLTASAKGVRISLEHAMEALSLPCPDLSDYTLYVGPPLEDIFRDICSVPEELIPQAMQLYRDYYDIHALSVTTVFDGIFPTLRALREAGCTLVVCTSKNEPVAVKVADDLGLTPYFDAICGSALDGSRKAKADMIPYALQTVGCADKAKAVMIGDTYFDARGAEIAGVDFLGVTYGYGTRESMERYGAKGFADSPEELWDLLCRGGS